jgi:protein-S-isoprenylcysteine O-methyltransferase Ste14
MYLAAATAVAGAAIFYESPILAAYAALFLVGMHALVVTYEEPTLRKTFGEDYDRYCAAVRRWRPVWPARQTEER